MLTPLATGGGPAADPALVALMMAVAARRREESRGAHFRADFPGQAVQARPSLLALDEALSTAADLTIQIPLARSA
jgi:L-aspartate oxidase